MKNRSYLVLLGTMAWGLAAAGCQTVAPRPEATHSNVEPGWIRDGEPIEFEGKSWYPLDVVEDLLDTEVFIVGRYQDVEFFVDRVDVRPYNRLYTRFSRNKYRAFEQRSDYDSYPGYLQGHQQPKDLERSLSGH